MCDSFYGYKTKTHKNEQIENEISMANNKLRRNISTM